MDYTEIILAIITGVGLSAACGFRIFIPLLFLNLASLYGFVHLSPGFGWAGGYFATIAFSLATCLEIAAYYIPWLDNLMDSIAAPASVIAGTFVTASVVTDISPSLKWIVSIIAGGGVAGILQGSTALLRMKSSLFTGGTANAIISTIELAASILFAILALLLPVIGLVLVFVLVLYLLIKPVRTMFKKITSRNSNCV